MESISRVLVLGCVLFSIGGCTSKPTPPPTPGSAQYAKAQAQLFAEMYRLVFKKTPSWEEFNGWTSVLSQGASLEGVYRGLILSREYRALEEQGVALRPEQLQAWMALAKELIQPLPDPKTLARASGPFLIRKMGEAALAKIDSFGADRERLAQWYAAWVMDQAPLGIDFGLRERNSVDPAFHLKFAREIAVDRLRWEVLNRVHRILDRTSR